MGYWKRGLKGLPTPKETVVKSLAEYINLFSNDGLQHYIFRGEPTNYHNIVSSAFRNLEYEYVSESRELTAKIEKQYGTVELAVLEYTLKLQMFLRQTTEVGATVWWLNCIPNFLYAPILSFERGRNQQGLFIYQAYHAFEEGAYETRVLSQQRVWPGKIIVVENKEKVLKELDTIGINQKFIYGDYDNIARYIKNKYDK